MNSRFTGERHPNAHAVGIASRSVDVAGRISADTLDRYLDRLLEIDDDDMTEDLATISA